MSKKDGMLFSNSLFGYRKKDVNEFIKRSDISHADQLSLLQAENERLMERAKSAESKVEELEELIRNKDDEFSMQLDRITQEFELKLQEAVAKNESQRSQRSLFSIFGRGKKK